jgi:predicted TIM-barrel fold metal-dependent hydrolase
LKILIAEDDLLYRHRLRGTLSAWGYAVVETGDGAFWQAEGVSWGPSGRKEKGYLEKRAFGFRPATPSLRLEDMDEDGVRAQVIFGPPQGFRTQDPALGLACFQAYNDWALAFNQAAPQRLVALPMLPVAEPALATAELERVDVEQRARLGPDIDHGRANP